MQIKPGELYFSNQVLRFICANDENVLTYLTAHPGKLTKLICRIKNGTALFAKCVLEQDT
jgi:hypothetical protein